MGFIYRAQDTCNTTGQPSPPIETLTPSISGKTLRKASTQDKRNKMPSSDLI